MNNKIQFSSLIIITLLLFLNSNHTQAITIGDNLNFQNSWRILNLLPPSAPGDIATQGYVDSKIGITSNRYSYHLFT
jgi:hypothetical protein